MDSGRKSLGNPVFPCFLNVMERKPFKFERNGTQSFKFRPISGDSAWTFLAQPSDMLGHATIGSYIFLQIILTLNHIQKNYFLSNFVTNFFDFRAGSDEHVP